MGKVTSIRTARRQTANGRAEPIEKLLAGARLQLIETGNRNRLIVTRGAQAARAHHHRQCIRSGAAISFAKTTAAGSRGREIANIQGNGDTGNAAYGHRGQAAGRFADITPPGFCISGCKRCTATRVSPRRSAACILFLAFGFLRWYEDESDMPRDAAILLRSPWLMPSARLRSEGRRDAIATNRALRDGCWRFRHRPARCCGIEIGGRSGNTSTQSPMRLPPNGDGRSTPMPLERLLPSRSDDDARS